MKPSHLVALVVVLAALVGATYWATRGGKKRPSKPFLARVVTLPAETTALTLSLPGEGEGDAPRLVLRLAKDGNGWRMPTAWNASADPAKVKDFLDRIAQLRGELRPAADPRKLGLDPASALVVTFEGGANAAAATLRIGKTPEDDAARYFVQGSNGKTYLVPGEFRRWLGVTEAGTWREAAPGHRPWLLTRVAGLPGDALASVTLTYPDHEIQLERIPASTPPPSADPAAPAPTSASGDVSTAAVDVAGAAPSASAPDAASKGKEKEAAPVWRVARGPAESCAPAALDTLLRVVESLHVVDVVDPEAWTDLNLDTAPYRLTATRSDGVPPLRVGVTRRAAEAGGEEAFALVTDAQPGQVFTVSAETFRRMFPDGRDLFGRLTANHAIDVEQIRHAQYSAGRQSVGFRRHDDGWRTEGGPGYPLRVDALERLIRDAAAWSPADYAELDDHRERLGVLQPAAQLLLVDAQGDTRTYRLGGRHPFADGRYVEIGDAAVAYRSPDADVRRLFPGFGRLLDLRLMRGLVDNPEEPAPFSAEVTWPGNGSGWNVYRNAAALPPAHRPDAEGPLFDWLVATTRDGDGTRPSGEPQRADSDAMLAWRKAVVALEGVDLYDGDDAVFEKPDALVVVNLGVPGKTIKLEYAFGPEVDGRRALKPSGRVAVWVDAASAARVLCALADLALPADPEPAAEEGGDAPVSEAPKKPENNAAVPSSPDDKKPAASPAPPASTDGGVAQTPEPVADAPAVDVKKTDGEVVVPPSPPVPSNEAVAPAA